jgi:hypothetical protein
MLTARGLDASLKAAIAKIEPYFEGSGSEASPATQRLFRNFQYQNDLMLNA